MFRLGSGLIIILAVAAGLLVGTLNADPVSLDLLWVQLEWPLGLLAMLFLATGVLLGLLLSWLMQVLPLKMRLRQAGKALAPANDKESGLNGD